MINRFGSLKRSAVVALATCVTVGQVFAAGESWLDADIRFYDEPGSKRITHGYPGSPSYILECFLDGQEPPILLYSHQANPSMLVSNDIPILYRAVFDDGRVYAYYEDVQIPELYFCIPADFAAAGHDQPVSYSGLADGAPAQNGASIIANAYIADKVSGATWSSFDSYFLSKKPGPGAAPVYITYRIEYLAGNTLYPHDPDVIVFNSVIPLENGFSIGAGTLIFGDQEKPAGTVVERKIFVRPEVPEGPVTVTVSMDGYADYGSTFELRKDSGHFINRVITPLDEPGGYLGPEDIEDDFVILPVPANILQRAIAWDLTGQVDDFLNLEKHMYPGLVRAKDVSSLIAVASH